MSLEPDQTKNPGDLELPPNVRRSNWRLLVTMAVFAVALGIGCFLWMYGRMAGQRELERTAPATPDQITNVAPTNPPQPSVAPR